MFENQFAADDVSAGIVTRPSKMNDDMDFDSLTNGNVDDNSPF